MDNNVNLPIKISDSQMQQYVSRLIADEFTSISKPCYFPKFVRYKEEIINRTGFNNNLAKEFLAGLSPKYNKFGILQDKYTLNLIMAMLHYTKTNMKLARMFYQLLALKFYSSIAHRFFPKYCQDEIWDSTLETISPKHLFRIKHGISNAVGYISTVLFDRYSPKLKTPKIDDYDLIRTVYDLRTRIFNSFRSFAEAYYKINESRAIKTIASVEKDDIIDIQLVADKVSMSICTFGQVDQNSLVLAINRSGIRKDVATTIISDISSVEYQSKMKFILILIGRLSPIKDVCRDTTRNNLVRKIEMGRKIGNYSAKEEMLSLMYSTENGFRLKTMNSSQLVIFLSNYILKYTSTKIC